MSASQNLSGYPLIAIQHISNPNRLYAIPVFGGLVKIIMTLPQSIVIYLLSFIIPLILIVNSLMVLFTGKYWDLAYRMIKGQMILFTKTLFFTYGLTNKYPGFSLFSLQDNYQIIIDYPIQPNRLFAFPVFGGIVRFIFLIPFSIWLFIVMVAGQAGVIISSIPVLFLGKYPESTFELAVDSIRLYNSTIMYYAGLSDRYPSFSISMKHKLQKILLLSISIVIFIGSLILPIMLLFINSSAKFQQANNMKRLSDINNILNAVDQYEAENHGQLSITISHPNEEIASGVGNADLCPVLVSTYLPDMPTDPLVNNGVPESTCSSYDTGYTISIENNKVTISAPKAENGARVSVTR